LLDAVMKFLRNSARGFCGAVNHQHDADTRASRPSFAP
jgi:hypothetical protein